MTDQTVTVHKTNITNKASRPPVRPEPEDGTSGTRLPQIRTCHISAYGSSDDSPSQVDPELSDRYVDMPRTMFNMLPSIDSAGRRFAFLHWVLRGEFPGFNGTIKALRHPTAISPHFVSFAWRYLNVHSLCSLPGGRVHRQRPGVGNPVSPAGISPRRQTGSPKFLGNLNCPFAMFQSDAGRTACTRPLRCSSVALGHRRAKAPTKGLSTLNSMAFGLAVYASQCGLLQHHARLASSCWSGSTGRAFHPQGSDERFQSCSLHLIPLSQASWRNRCNLPHES